MDLSLANFVFLLLGVSGGVVVVGTLVSCWTRRRVENRALAKRMICRLCLRSFESPENAEIAVCPVCGTGNQR